MENHFSRGRYKCLEVMVSKQELLKDEEVQLSGLGVIPQCERLSV